MYPHRCLGGDPFVWACRCKATPDPNSDKAARDGWGSGCRVAMEERIADLEAELAARGTCSDPLTALLDRLAEGAQVAAEEVDAAVGLVATFDSEAPPLAGLGGEQMQRVRLEVACVRGDSLTPQARLREYRLRAERAEAERDAATAALTALRTYLTRSVADEMDVHEAWDILNGLVPGDLALVLKWVDEIDGRPKKPVQIPAVLFHRLLSAGLKDAEGDVLEWITARVERCAEAEAERDAALSGTVDTETCARVGVLLEDKVTLRGEVAAMVTALVIRFPALLPHVLRQLGWDNVAARTAHRLATAQRDIASLRGEMERLEGERDAALAEARRLRDLVRHQRGPLHDAELLTDEEYAALAASGAMYQREVARARDRMRRRNAEIRKRTAARLAELARGSDA